MTKRPVFQYKRRHHPWSIYGPFTVFRASKDGGPLLKENVRRFRDINGFMLQTKGHRLMVEFRRRGA
jgi:hypothetical protein